MYYVPVANCPPTSKRLDDNWQRRHLLRLLFALYLYPLDNTTQQRITEKALTRWPQKKATPSERAHSHSLLLAAGAEQSQEQRNKTHAAR